MGLNGRRHKDFLNRWMKKWDWMGDSPSPKTWLRAWEPESLGFGMAIWETPYPCDSFKLFSSKVKATWIYFSLISAWNPYGPCTSDSIGAVAGFIPMISIYFDYAQLDHCNTWSTWPILSTVIGHSSRIFQIQRRQMTTCCDHKLAIRIRKTHQLQSHWHQVFFAPTSWCCKQE